MFYVYGNFLHFSLSYTDEDKKQDTDSNYFKIIIKIDYKINFSDIIINYSISV